MPKKVKELQLLPLLRKYINDIKKGRHLQPDGKRIRKSSLENYLYLEKLLQKFCLEKSFELRAKIIPGLRKKELDAEQKYCKNFYREFTDYLYDDLGHFDNYVLIPDPSCAVLASLYP
jgi:hypothetical protein